MPIQFPPPKMGAFFDRPEVTFSPKTLNYIPAPNMDAPGKAFVAFQCDLGKQNKNINFIELGRTYRNPALTSVVPEITEPFGAAAPFCKFATYDRRLARMNTSLTGVSRDSAGAPLGLCRIMLFRSFDNAFVTETTSDANGNWSIQSLVSGPFFIREEKPAAALMQFYFHVEDTVNGAPVAPAGNATLSETIPDQLDAAGHSGGHVSTSGAVAASLLNKPEAIDETGVTGLPPQDATPIAAHRFGWFSDATYNGEFVGNDWKFQWREDDDSNGIVGRPIINLFASTSRDFAGTMRLLAQFDPASDAGGMDWWLAASNAIGSWTLSAPLRITLTNEYLFLQLWCYESAGLASGKTLIFNQEGSDLADAARSYFRTPLFLSFANRVAGASVQPIVVTVTGG